MVDVSEFYYDEGEMWLIDADIFLSETKQMVLENLGNIEFGIYIGINKDNQLEIWAKDADDHIYKVDVDYAAMNDS